MHLSLGRASDARRPGERPRRRCTGLYSGRVTRIIAGAAGSLSLEVPESGTRPTSDRVRESVFGSLDASGAIAGARVLDLYAGSGALGLEALSRGAASVDLVVHCQRDATGRRRVTEIVEPTGLEDGVIRTRPAPRPERQPLMRSRDR